MTSAQLHTSKDSKGIIHGEFPFIFALDTLVAKYPEAVAEAVAETLSNEQTHLSNVMSDHPDWAHLSDKAQVSISDGSLEYGVNEPSDETNMLEFGDPSKRVVATGLLRSTAFKRSQDIKKQLTEAVSRKLGGF
jgi:hypothetical protein